MPLSITAVLDAQTLTELIDEVTPLTLNLGDGDPGSRWMRVERPDHLAFVAGKGVRVRTAAQLQWTLAGAALRFTIQSMVLRLEPAVSAFPTAGRLNVRVTVEEADLKNVPRLIDHSLLGLINASLAARPDAIGWNFAKTLGARLKLPASMAPLERFTIDAGDMSLELADASIRATLALPMHFTRGDRPTPAISENDLEGVAHRAAPARGAG